MATMKELKDQGGANTQRPSTAVETVNAAEVDTIAALIGKIGATVDSDKAVVATAMLNTFILAINRVGGRQTFTARDFMAYGVALASVNQILPSVDKAGDNLAQDMQDMLNK